MIWKTLSSGLYLEMVTSGIGWPAATQANLYDVNSSLVTTPVRGVKCEVMRAGSITWMDEEKERFYIDYIAIVTLNGGLYPLA